jgi:hypothetical protein
MPLLSPYVSRSRDSHPAGRIVQAAATPPLPQVPQQLDSSCSGPGFSRMQHKCARR